LFSVGQVEDRICSLDLASFRISDSGVKNLRKEKKNFLLYCYAIV
jgi:hypothetical protein